MKTLEAEEQYKIGKFIVLLYEDTGELKVRVHTLDDLSIHPRSDNSVIVKAVKPYRNINKPKSN